jgi:hypothetical protein
MPSAVRCGIRRSASSPISSSRIAASLAPTGSSKHPEARDHEIVARALEPVGRSIAGNETHIGMTGLHEAAAGDREHGVRDVDRQDRSVGSDRGGELHSGGAVAAADVDNELAGADPRPLISSSLTGRNRESSAS